MQVEQKIKKEEERNKIEEERVPIYQKQSQTLFTSSAIFNFPKVFLKVHHFFPTFDDGLVFLALTSLATDSLIHVAKGGKIKYQKNFCDLMDSLAMPNNKMALVLDVRNSQIFQINLQTHQETYYIHHYMVDVSCQCDIEVFHKTRMICIRQNGGYDDNRLQLSYYSYPFSNLEYNGNRGPYVRPDVDQQFVDNQWTHQYSIYKGNNHSMFIWIKPRHDLQFDVRIFDLKNGYKNYKIKNPIRENYGLDRLECVVNYIWEMSEGKLCAVCQTTRPDQTIKMGPQNQVINNNIIIDYLEGTVRESRFYFDPKYNSYLVDCFSTGQFMMFRTFYFEKGETLTSPAYYIDNNTEEIAARDQWKCDHLSKFALLPYDSSIFFEGLFENADVSTFTLVIRKICCWKEISLHMLLQLNGDFDEDLLADTIKILF